MLLPSDGGGGLRDRARPTVEPGMSAPPGRPLRRLAARHQVDLGFWDLCATSSRAPAGADPLTALKNKW